MTLLGTLVDQVIQRKLEQLHNGASDCVSSDVNAAASASNTQRWRRVSDSVRSLCWLDRVEWCEWSGRHGASSLAMFLYSVLPCA